MNTREDGGICPIAGVTIGINVHLLISVISLLISVIAASKPSEEWRCGRTPFEEILDNVFVFVFVSPRMINDSEERIEFAFK